MARKPRICIGGYAQHIVQRGNKRSVCFARADDYIAYAHWLKEGAVKYGIDVHAWVFMTNHVHLLITPKEDGVSAALIQYIGRYYVRRFNFNYKRTGTLWEGRYKSSLIDNDRYVLACYRYIEMNPVRAKMAATPNDYQWSSYHTSALGINSTIITPHPSYMSLSDSDSKRRKSYRAIFDAPNKNEMDAQIRFAANKGLATGGEKFKLQIEALTHVPQRLKRRGLRRSFYSDPKYLFIH